ncbi:MAG: exodeoxyribonuclease V subunit alpha, partial [Candidatus Muiribacteriota bacterium]
FSGDFDWETAISDKITIGNSTEYKPLIFDGGRLYLHKYYEYEKMIINKIKHLSQKEFHPPIPLPEVIDFFNKIIDSSSNKWQKIAAFLSIYKQFVVITGGPGTGKTYTVSKIISLWLKINPEIKIALAAPTGKAAVRMMESINQAKKTLTEESIIDLFPKEAFTIHRLLGTVRYSTKFRHNKNNPLPYDLIIIDEASMIDLPMMAKLLDSLSENTQIILLGDRNQLASVEVGAVFGDICSQNNVDSFTLNFMTLVSEKLNLIMDVSKNSRKSTGWIENCIVELKESRRFSQNSGIGNVSRIINTGNYNLFENEFENNDYSDIQLISEFSANIRRNLKKYTEEIYNTFFNKIINDKKINLEEKIKETFNFLKKFKILCALRKGITGVENINNIMEDLLGFNQIIYDGKPIIVMENDYSVKLFNGDTGVFLEDKNGNIKAYFQDSNGNYRAISPARLPIYESAYAMTIHKSQGSEWEKVLIILPDNNFSEENQILTREILYTGITRARNQVVLAANKTVLKNTISSKIQRLSGF